MEIDKGKFNKENGRLSLKHGNAFKSEWNKFNDEFTSHHYDLI